MTSEVAFGIAATAWALSAILATWSTEQLMDNPGAGPRRHTTVLFWTAVALSTLGLLVAVTGLR